MTKQNFIPHDQPISAYWFAAGDTLPHGDGRKIALGKAHTLRGVITLCEHALHACRDPFDALGHAPGNWLYRVECSGRVVEQFDKLGCSHRRYVARIDATALALQFAREQALSVAHLWDMPDFVRQFLETGDTSLTDAAAKAAIAAAPDTAYAAARKRFNELVTEAFAKVEDKP